MSDLKLNRTKDWIQDRVRRIDDPTGRDWLIMHAKIERDHELMVSMANGADLAARIAALEAALTGVLDGLRTSNRKTISDAIISAALVLAGISKESSND